MEMVKRQQKKKDNLFFGEDGNDERINSK